MKLCLSVITTSHGNELSSWKGAETLALYDPCQNVFELNSLKALEAQNEGTKILKDFKEWAVNLVICQSMPPMVERILHDLGIQTLYTEEKDLEGVIEQWRQNRLSPLPLPQLQTSSCMGSCGSCSSGGC